MDPAFHHKNESQPGDSAFEAPLRWDEPIYIPPAAQHQPLWAFRLSYGALFFLNHYGFGTAGDLHGWHYREFRRFEGCDLKFLSEIHGLVAQLHQVHRLSPSAVRHLLPPPPRRIAVRPQPQTAAGSSPVPVGGQPAVPWPLPHEKFAVPPSARDIDIYSAPLSGRLRNVLYYSGVHRLGELDGLPCQDLLNQRNCGHKTIAELHQAIERAARGDQPARPWFFWVPQPVRTLKVSDLPFSVRAKNVLNGLEVICLGDLEGRRCDHPHLKNCGRKTIEEYWRMIERAVAGEFEPPDAAQWKPEAMSPLLDALIDQLPERKRLAVCHRFGAEDGVKASLASVAGRIGSTRERVRQIEFSLGRLSALPLKAHLELLKKRCRPAALSPALLGQWLGAAPRRYSLPFYVRLIAVLDRDIKLEGV